MERLTETKFDKEMRIGFSKIDRIFDDAISKLDAMKAEYEAKLQHKPSKMIDDIYAIFAKMQGDAARQFGGLIVGDNAYNSLRNMQMPISFDRGQNDMSVAARFAMMGGVGFAPVYRSPLICSGIA